MSSAAAPLRAGELASGMTGNIGRLLFPRSIAIVGVSEDPKTIRGRLLHVLLQRGYSGPLHLVSRRLKTVLGRPTFSSITAIPEVVDLVILASPSEAVPDLLDECGRKGIKAVLVIASGFAEERGEGGAQRQRRLREIAARYNIAICGPNTEGFVNNLEKVSATFCPTLENPAISLDASVGVAKRIAVVSQSGGFAFTFLNLSQQRQISYSFMISSGNESCLETGDYVDFLLEQGGTDLFLLYLEGVTAPERLRAALSRAADCGKPVIAVKSGRSRVGRQAAASHTGALSGEARVWDALFREYGVVQGESLEQMIDTAVAFSYCNPPSGRRIGLISNSGGGAVWMADMLIEQGFEIIPFDEETRRQIEVLLPSYGAAGNPVDLTATAVRQVGYAHMVEIVSKCAEVDSIIVIGSLAYEYVIEKDRDAFARVRAKTDKPIVFCTYTTASPRAVELLASAGIPAFTSMPNCVCAMRALTDYGVFQRCWQRDLDTRSTRPGDVRPSVASAVSKRLRAAPQALSEVRAKDLLVDYGLPRMRERLVANEMEAVVAAGEIGFPVALKVQSQELLHKSEAGAVVIGIKDETALREAFKAMQQRIAPAISFPVEGFLVQQMAGPGLEMAVGITRDPQFGPMLMLGFGGVFVELLDDVVLVPVPVGKARVIELLQGLRGAKLFSGIRGMPAIDLEALANIAWRLSWFAHDQRDLVLEVDLNPVIVHPKGVSVVDALIIRAAEVRTPEFAQQESGEAHV